jgi:addiction module HigA family antidote
LLIAAELAKVTRPTIERGQRGLGRTLPALRRAATSRAAEILKVRRATLSDLLHGKAALTPEMALRIEKAFGPDMNHLLRMQLA